MGTIDALVAVMLSVCAFKWAAEYVLATTVEMKPEEVQQHRRYLTAFGLIVIGLCMWLVGRLIWTIAIVIGELLSGAS